MLGLVSEILFWGIIVFDFNPNNQSKVIYAIFIRESDNWWILAVLEESLWMQRNQLSNKMTVMNSLTRKDIGKEVFSLWSLK